MTRVSDCLAGFLIAAVEELTNWSTTLSVSCRPFGGRERPAWPPINESKRKSGRNREGKGKEKEWKDGEEKEMK